MIKPIEIVGIGTQCAKPFAVTLLWFGAFQSVNIQFLKGLQVSMASLQSSLIPMVFNVFSVSTELRLAAIKKHILRNDLQMMYHDSQEYPVNSSFNYKPIEHN